VLGLGGGLRRSLAVKFAECRSLFRYGNSPARPWAGWPWSARAVATRERPGYPLLPANPRQGLGRAKLGPVTTAPGTTPNRRISPIAAATILSERDPVVALLIADAGPPRFRRPQESHFAALVRAIVYQQLAGAAAAAIHGRLVAAMAGVVEPAGLLALSDESLRAVGLSANKAASVRDLAAKLLDGTVVLSPRGLARQSDEEVTACLSSVRGIGPWTAQMFLMFQLRRLDVWPTGDLGVRRGYGLAWNVPMPTARQLQPLGDPFRPYRTVLAWYCWRAAEMYSAAVDTADTASTASSALTR
jgi:DNA-3-methyladenine glycosylase II